MKLLPTSNSFRFYIFDNEGNPLNGHCFLDSIHTADVVNARSNTPVAMLKILPEFEVGVQK
jgi:hypothetical protein